MRSRRADRFTRRVASRIANTVRRWILGDACPDSACGLKLFPKDAFLVLPFFEGMHRFLPALFSVYGYSVRLVAVEERPRLAGRSKYGIVSRGVGGLVDLLGVLWLRSRMSLP